MARPKRKRLILNPPSLGGFNPFGNDLPETNPIFLLYEEFEAIRLADYFGLTQSQAAEIMAVSRPTFSRIYDKARKTIATAFVEGKAILVDGGCYDTGHCWHQCKRCARIMVTSSEKVRCNYCNATELQPLYRVDQSRTNASNLVNNLIKRQ